MIVHLPQMIREMSGNVHQEIGRPQIATAHRNRICRLPLLGLEPCERSIYRFGCCVDPAAQLGAGEVTGGELGLPVAHVSRPAEYRADEVLEIADQVQDDGSRRVRYAGRSAPERIVVGVSVHLAAERAEIA